MRLSPSKFEALVWFLFKDSDVDEETTGYLFRLPRFLQRGRAALHGNVQTHQLMSELYTIHHKLLRITSELRGSFKDAPNSISSPTVPYGFCLALCCVFNYMLRGLKFDDIQLLVEGEELVEATLALAHDAARFRPLGAGHMLLNFCTAWMCTDSSSKRLLVEDALYEYGQDFIRNRNVRMPTPMLEILSSDLHFEMPLSGAVSPEIVPGAA